MAGKGRFFIPTSEEMDQEMSTGPVKSLFKTHQAVVKSNIKNKTPAEDSFISRSSSDAQKSSSDTSSVTNVQSAQNSKPGSLSDNSNKPFIKAGLTLGTSSQGHKANGTLSNQRNNINQASNSIAKSMSATNQQTKPIPTANVHENNKIQVTNSTSGTPQLGSDKPTNTSGSNSRTDSVASKTNGATTLPDKPVSVPVTPPRPGVGKAGSLIVSARQRGNPVLKSIRNIPWEYGDIVPDYVMGQTSCALFLSLRYHQLNNNYIHERLKQLGHSYNLRVLLVQVDIKDPHHCLKEVAKICLLSDCTLMLAWSPEEAGRYLETYKSFEHKPPDLIMEKTETNFVGRVTDFLTSARKVNKTDAATLLSTFGTVSDVIQASEEDMSLCPGFGPQKAKRLHNIFHEPFLKAKKPKPSQTEQGQTHSGTSQGTPTKQR